VSKGEAIIATELKVVGASKNNHLKKGKKNLTLPPPRLPPHFLAYPRVTYFLLSLPKFPKGKNYYDHFLEMLIVIRVVIRQERMKG